MTFVIGLTGGIGSGKTAVSDYFATLDITIIDADVIAHALTAKGSPVLDILKAKFGDWVVDNQGNYDRVAMRAYIFDKPNELATLNAIIHPLIFDKITQQLQASNSPYTILSVPLLLEGRHKSPSLLSLCHHLLVVDVPTDLQLQRASLRDTTTPSQIQAIINRQISRDERLSLAKTLGADVVDNTGTLDELHSKLAPLHEDYLAMAKPA